MGDSFLMTESKKCRDRQPLDFQKNLCRNWADIKEVLLILDSKNSTSKESFFETYGQQQVTLIHLASYAGRLEMLNHAAALQLDLYITDKVGRCALHYAAGEGHVDVVRWFVERSTDPQLSFQDSFGRTALHLAVQQKHVDIVKILVDANVDVNIRDKAKMTPLHLTWSRINRNSPEEMGRYEQIVDILLSSTNFRKFVDEPLGVVGKIFNTTVLNSAVRLNSPATTRKLLEHGLIITRPYQTQQRITALHIAAEHGFYQTLIVLLEYRHLMSWMINMRDEKGKTPLHVAVSEGHLRCAHVLAYNGGSLLSEAKNGRTVIEALFRYNEQPMTFLTELLDAGVYMTETNGDVVNLDFKVLTPEAKLQMAVVSALISTLPSMKQMNILQHPLVEAFIGLKWKRLSYSFLILVAFQAIFVACLFMYGRVLLKEKSNHPVQRRMLFVCAITMLLHNILQLIMIPKYYVKQFDTWMSFTYAIICVVVPVAGEFGFKDLQQNGLPPVWALQSISIAILLACIQMMLLIGRFRSWGYYALMFSAVMKNVLKVFLAVVWIIVGFSLSFSIIFHDNDQFDNPWKAFVKTMLMMMGEYEYSDLFKPIDDNNKMLNATSVNQEYSILLPITSRLVFLAFVMLASIILMNLMVGLAVIDIQGLLNEGLILRLMKHAEFVTHLEQVTSHWIFRSRFFPGSVRKLLEAKNTIPTQLSISSSARRGKHPSGICKKLVEKLFDLASKNENLHRKTQESSSHGNHGDSLIETISRLEEEFKKLKQEITERRDMQFPKCNVEIPENCTDSQNKKIVFCVHE